MAWRGICLVLLAGLPAVLTCGAASGQDVAEEAVPAAAEGISTQFDLAYVTKYVWRAFVLNDDPAVQPSLTLSHPSGLSFNWWGTLDTTDIAGERWNITEIDYTLNYTWEAGKACLNTGVGRFTYPQGGAVATGEVYASATLEGVLSPTLSINYDYDEIEGAYISLGISRDCRIPSGRANPISVGLSAQIGYGTAHYNKGYFGVDKGALNDLLITAALPLAVGDGLTVTPYMSYSRFIDDDLEEAARSAGYDPTNVFGGVVCSFTF